MPTLTATIVLAKNGFTTTDFSAINTEYMIDDAIDWVNNQTDRGIANMSGSAGTKTVTLSSEENAAVSPLISVVLRENKKTSLSNSSVTSGGSSTSNSIGVGSVSLSESNSVSNAISATSAINNPANTFYLEMVKAACERLKELSSDLA